MKRVSTCLLVLGLGLAAGCSPARKGGPGGEEPISGALVLSVIALSVSLFNAVWAVVWPLYLHRRELREKAEQDREKVKLTPLSRRDGAGSAFVVEVYNDSAFALHIKAVELFYYAGPSGPGSAIRMISPTRARMPLAGPMTAEEVTLGFREALTLPQRQRVSFEPPVSAPLSTLESISRLPEDRVWVAVSTPTGEIARLPGSSVLPRLKEVVAAAKNPRPAVTQA